MAVCRFGRAIAWIASIMLCASAGLAADRPFLDVTQTVKEIVGACAIESMDKLEKALSSKLEEFLGHSIELKAAKSVALTELFAQLPTDVHDTLERDKDPRARQLFFSVYFKCIRDQTSLKLKSLNIPLE